MGGPAACLSKRNLLVRYVGSNGPVIDLLEEIMGAQFAGADATTVEPNSYADAEVQSYLSLMVELASYLRGFTSGRAPDEFAIDFRLPPSLLSPRNTWSSLQNWKVLGATTCLKPWKISFGGQPRT